KPDGAIAAFDASLRRMPNRPRSLLGLARASVALGNVNDAREHYESVAGIWKDRNVPELKEVEEYLTAHKPGSE
ncbi:MAG: tetratricopeptide repeat protein, partial [Pseudomonadota bacterium]